MKGEMTILEEVVNKIIEINEDNEAFWSKSYGWATTEAADLLNISRLDWQTSLSYSLKMWIDKSDAGVENEDGKLILAWTNLGTLVEGTMKLLLCVYYNQYKNDPDVILLYDRKLKTKVVAEPDVAAFELLRTFFNKKIWVGGTEDWNTWVLKIQQRRNAIHAFKHRDIGSFKEFYDDIRVYLKFLEEHIGRLPRP
jgi:hypothetical protein